MGPWTRVGMVREVATAELRAQRVDIEPTIRSGRRHPRVLMHLLAQPVHRGRRTRNMRRCRKSRRARGHTKRLGILRPRPCPKPKSSLLSLLPPPSITLKVWPGLQFSGFDEHPAYLLRNTQPVWFPTLSFGFNDRIGRVLVVPGHVFPIDSCSAIRIPHKDPILYQKDLIRIQLPRIPKRKNRRTNLLTNLSPHSDQSSKPTTHPIQRRKQHSPSKKHKRGNDESQRTRLVVENERDGSSRRSDRIHGPRAPTKFVVRPPRVGKRELKEPCERLPK